MRIAKFRKKHPRSIYKGFSTSFLSDDALEICYDFILEPGIRFRPQLTITGKELRRRSEARLALATPLIFSTGIVELLSYWKAACSPQIEVEAGPLTPAQCDWWRQLILNGMGEFFFTNKIDFRSPEFLTLTSSYSGPAFGAAAGSGESCLEEPLLMMSGGKDTLVSASLLRDAGVAFSGLLLNPLPAAKEIATHFGCKEQITIYRKIDPLLIGLNKEGYLNGHTPFSALLALLGLTVAKLLGYSTLIVSNERSAEEGNAQYLGHSINHQYSKSLVFEKAINEYVKKFLAPDLNYFSLLRPLYELQICGIAANSSASLLNLFRSCNRAAGTNSWCRECPKCLSTYLLLSPFLQYSKLNELFGGSMLENESLRPILNSLLGHGGEHKPFECVGTYEELRAALWVCAERLRRNGLPLPALLSYGVGGVLKGKHEGALARKILSEWSEDHLVPPNYVELLRTAREKLLDSLPGWI